MSNKRVVTLGEVLPERQTIGASHNSLSAFLFDGSDLHCSQAYDIAHIVDRVGSGDAFAAGLIYGLLP